MVIYEDKDFLNPVCLSLVVRVESINKAYGDIASFANKYKLEGTKDHFISQQSSLQDLMNLWFSSFTTSF